MKKQLLISGILALSLLSMTGCATKNEYFKSHESFKMDQTNNYILVNDFIDFVGDYYNPTNTKFVIDPKDDFSPFLAVMETRLREKGYGVSYAGMNEAAWLAWKIDKADENTIMVTYHIADSKYTRFYKMTTYGKYVPIGTFTIFNEKAKINQKEPEPIAPIVEEPKPEPKPMVIVVDTPSEVWDVFVQQNSYLHIREKPTTKSKIIGTLKKSTKVETTLDSKTNKKWGKLAKMDGYISKRYLKRAKVLNNGDVIYAK